MKFSSLVPVVALVTAPALAVANAESPLSLWDRLGGEAVVRPLVSDIYDDHARDPLSAPYFGVHAFSKNTGDAVLVKERVFQFFSAGIGGPHTYEGEDMITAHKHMKIDEQAFHAVAYHVLSNMEKHGAGGRAEREEVLGILNSLKANVQTGNKNKNANAPFFANSQGQASGFGLDPVAALHYLFTRGIQDYVRTLPLPRNAADISNLSLDDWYSLFPLIVAVLSPLILVLFATKVKEAHNLDKNSSGLFQFSRFFYSGYGPIVAAPFLLGYVPGALALLGAHWAGQWSWVTFVAGYILLPILDLIVGEDSYNPTQEEEDRMKNNIWFRVVTWFYTPSYIATIIYAAHVIYSRPELTTFEVAGITAGVGIAGGFGIGCVHEMIHRPHFYDLFNGIVATVFANYSHFWIEHLWGHHKHVATDEDPASSALGDDLYTFLVKDIYLSFTEALEIESKFQTKYGKPFYKNRILQGYTASALIAAAIYSTYGTRALYFYLAQGFIVALHIENANFIEHYGLRRNKREDGRYERPGWFHAWDTADRLTNWFLFKIQRHPDHHTNAGRPYQILRTLPQSPTMPTGYAGMFVLSWFPPLWWAVMDPLVENAYNQRFKMETKGVVASSFPKGANNISSFFKLEGADHFEKGSSPYSTGAAFSGVAKSVNVNEASSESKVSSTKHKAS